MPLKIIGNNVLRSRTYCTLPCVAATYSLTDGKVSFTKLENGYVLKSIVSSLQNILYIYASYEYYLLQIQNYHLLISKA